MHSYLNHGRKYLLAGLATVTVVVATISAAEAKPKQVCYQEPNVGRVCQTVN